MSEALTEHIVIEQFEGPFHTLVDLLESQKLDITSIALATVTEQYINAVNTQPYIDPYALADFLVISSRLLYLKSKTLLPMLVWDEEEDDSADLEKQLKIYKEYYEASKTMEGLLKQKRISVVRERLAIDVEVLFNPPHDLTTDKLQNILAKILNDLAPIVKIPKKVMERTVSIRTKIDHISSLIINKISTSFKDLLQGANNKAETIVTFLAVLELVKQRTVNVEQDILHGEIMIHKKES